MQIFFFALSPMKIYDTLTRTRQENGAAPLGAFHIYLAPGVKSQLYKNISY
jgi:hypothetical protein